MVSSSSQTPPASYDFLISYASADRAWAEWIGYILEEHKYKTFSEAWDIEAGKNILLERDQALKQTKHVLVVLSQDYMNDESRIFEWTTALQRDPGSRKRSLIPILIHDYSVEGFISILKPITLINMDEQAMSQELLNGLQPGRAKPSTRPAFPGRTSQAPQGKPHTENIQKPPFPQEYAPITRAVRAFIICSRASEDQRLLQQFLSALSPLQNTGVIQTWDSNNMLAGATRADEFTKQIKQADLILPLISSDFFNSEECANLAKLAFDTYQMHDGRIVPILLRPCLWEISEYATLEMLPSSHLALMQWKNRDEGLLTIIKGIKQVVDKLVLKKES